MFQEYEVLAGREMLEMAHAEAQNGIDVLVHIEGAPPLLLREIDPIAEGAACATVRTWADDEVAAATWIIPLASVRIVQVPDTVAASNIEKAESAHSDQGTAATI